MKKHTFALFFLVVLMVHTAINYYIFVHGWNALPPESSLRTPYLVLFVFFASAFLAARLLQRVWLSTLTILLDWIGAFWLGAMVYLLMAVIVIDLIQVANAMYPLYGNDGVALANIKITGFWIVTGLVALIVLAAHINARIPRVRRVPIRIGKSMGERRTLEIVMASDIHLGTIMHNRRLKRLIERINALEPELILLPGDVFDEDIGSVIKQNQGETLRTLTAPLGVFAITGNHEYIGGVEAACEYMSAHGIRVLRDESVVIPGACVIVGREDRAISQFTSNRRKPLSELVERIDRSFPVILMDHQPAHLEEAVANGIDLQLSGHTHHGQLWPFGFITKRVYELSWGYLRKGATQFYVSCGLGTWGPPMRSGNRPEIVVITVECEMTNDE